MDTKKLSKSIRKFIRGEKAQIRREASGIKEQDRLINELYQKFHQACVLLTKYKEKYLKSKDTGI